MTAIILITLLTLLTLRTTLARRGWWMRFGDACSQVANVLIWDGDANHSVSGDAYRFGRHRLRRVIDTLFLPWEREHCRRSHEADVLRAEALLADDAVRRAGWAIDAEGLE